MGGRDFDDIDEYCDLLEEEIGEDECALERPNVYCDEEVQFMRELRLDDDLDEKAQMKRLYEGSRDSYFIQRTLNLKKGKGRGE